MIKLGRFLYLHLIDNPISSESSEVNTREISYLTHTWRTLNTIKNEKLQLIAVYQQYPNVEIVKLRDEINYKAEVQIAPDFHIPDLLKLLTLPVFPAAEFRGMEDIIWYKANFAGVKNVEEYFSENTTKETFYVLHLGQGEYLLATPKLS